MEGICNARTLADPAKTRCAGTIVVITPFLNAGILLLGRKLVVQVVYDLDCTVQVNKKDEGQDRNPAAQLAQEPEDFATQGL